MPLLVTFIGAFIQVLSQALTVAIFIRVLLSWVPMRLPFGLNEFVWSVTEPILGPIRRSMPVAMGMDFSPFIALIAIQVVAGILLQLLPAPF